MDLPKCCNKKCFNISGFYLEKKNKYACHSWAQLKFLKDQKVLIIDPKVPNDTLTGLSQCIKLFSQSVNEDDDEDTMEEAKTLIAKFDEEISQLSSKLEKSSSDGAYHHFMSIQEDAQKLFDSLKKENLYIEFATKFVFDQTLHQCSGNEHSSQSHKTPQPQVVNTPMHAEHYAWGDGTPACNNQGIGQIKERLEKLTEEINNLDPTLGQHKTTTLTVINSMNTLLKHFEGIHEKRINQLKDYDELYKTELEQKDKLIKILQDDAQKESDKLHQQLYEKDQEIDERNKKITELLKTKDVPMELELECMKAQTWDSTTLPQIESYTKGEFSDLHNKNVGYPSEVDPDSTLTLDLDDKSHLKLISAAKKRFPNMECLRIFRLRNVEQSLLKKLIVNHCPLEVQKLKIGFNTCHRFDYSIYLKEMGLISKNVTKELQFWDFKFKQDNIAKIFENYKHVEKINFHFCLFEIFSSPDFIDSLQGSKIKNIWFDYVGFHDWGDWKEDHTHFINLIKGLSKSEDFKKSVEMIEVTRSGLSDEDLKPILDKYGLENVALNTKFVSADY